MRLCAEGRKYVYKYKNIFPENYFVVTINFIRPIPKQLLQQIL